MNEKLVDLASKSIDKPNETMMVGVVLFGLGVLFLLYLLIKNLLSGLNEHRSDLKGITHELNIVKNDLGGVRSDFYNSWSVLKKDFEQLHDKLISIYTWIDDDNQRIDSRLLEVDKTHQEVKEMYGRVLEFARNAETGENKLIEVNKDLENFKTILRAHNSFFKDFYKSKT